MRIFAMIRSTIGLTADSGRSNDLVSVTIFTVLRVESQITWQVLQCATWSSSCWRTLVGTSLSK